MIRQAINELDLLPNWFSTLFHRLGDEGCRTVAGEQWPTSAFVPVVLIFLFSHSILRSGRLRDRYIDNTSAPAAGRAEYASVMCRERRKGASISIDDGGAGTCWRVTVRKARNDVDRGAGMLFWFYDESVVEQVGGSGD